MSKTRVATAAWAAVLASTVAAGGARAAVSEAEFEQMKAQMTALMQRVTALEQENAELRESTTGPTGFASVATSATAMRRSTWQRGMYAVGIVCARARGLLRNCPTR